MLADGGRNQDVGRIVIARCPDLMELSRKIKGIFHALGSRSEPNDNSSGMLVNESHDLDLAAALIQILLIDACCIAPRRGATRST